MMNLLSASLSRFIVTAVSLQRFINGIQISTGSPDPFWKITEKVEAWRNAALKRERRNRILREIHRKLHSNPEERPILN
jgi:hypothetical protein